MNFKSIRDFLNHLESIGELKRVETEVNPTLEMTEISDRTLKKNGPALLFENPTNHNIPVLTNLFGTQKRIAIALGKNDTKELQEVGKLLAELKEPSPPKSLKDAISKIPLLKQALKMSPKTIKNPVCQEVVIDENNIDLSQLPIQKCWPNDVSPLITWGITITNNINLDRLNLGIYRLQVLEKNKLIMRWLKHRGGALDFQEWTKNHPEKPFPVSIAIGCPPALTLSAVTPIPDTISEYSFAGLLGNNKVEVCKSISNQLLVPANAEIIIEGEINPGETAEEGPFADHTGYYNEVETFPVLTVKKITHRKDPIYHSTYTGRPPDEPAILGMALNEVFIPILKKQFPEITDFYLPPEGCSYRMAIVSINKQYPGHAKRVMFGIWSFLKQFMYTKFIIVTDDDIDIRKWEDVIWAITTRMDPSRDSTIVNNTPIDYLDFASPVTGLGSKIGLDATNKLPAETDRNWGETVKMNEEIKNNIDRIWDSLGI